MFVLVLRQLSLFTFLNLNFHHLGLTNLATRGRFTPNCLVYMEKKKNRRLQNVGLNLTEVVFELGPLVLDQPLIANDPA